MDGELIDEIAVHASTHGQLSVLPIEEAERWRRLVARRFDFPDDRTWWWESLPCDAFSIEYGQDDGLERLGKLLPASDAPLVLFVTDDVPPPWPCVTGSADALMGMLRAHRFFEYFIVPADLAWIVFDTHHDMLVGSGSGLNFAPPSSTA